MESASSFVVDKDLRLSLTSLRGWQDSGWPAGQLLGGKDFLSQVETESLLIGEMILAYGVYNAKNQIICDFSRPQQQSTGRIVLTNYRITFHPDAAFTNFVVPLVDLSKVTLKSKMLGFELIEIIFAFDSISSDMGGKDIQEEDNAIVFGAKVKQSVNGQSIYKNTRSAYEQAAYQN